MWEEWASANKAADRQQAMQQWANNHGISIKDDQGPMVMQRTMTQGILSPPIKDPDIGGEIMEKGNCQNSCASSFQFDNKLTTNQGVVNVRTTCTFKSCKRITVTVGGKKVQQVRCDYSCEATAHTIQ
jgi:hypothetical protein